MKSWFSMTFYDAASDYMLEIMTFYDFIMVILTFISIFVLWQLKLVMCNHFLNLQILEIQMLEFLVTVFPSLILIFMAIPSISLIYLFDQEASDKPMYPVKVTGFQWYWKYEHELCYYFTRLIYIQATSDDRYKKVGEILKSNLDLDHADYFSYYVTMKPVNLFNKTEIRLLDIIGELIVPFKAQTQMIVTSEDVLHSWAMPAMGMKADAIPGRLNKVNFIPVRLGSYYGQCSEICGAYHSFMPTKLTVLSFQMLDNSTYLIGMTKNYELAYHY